jgi:predicted transcriptional regulator
MVMVKVVHHANDRHFEKAVNATLEELLKIARIERISYTTTAVVNTEEGERHYFTAFIEYSPLSQRPSEE